MKPHLAPLATLLWFALTACTSDQPGLDSLLRDIDAAAGQVAAIRTINRHSEDGSEFELVGTAMNEGILVEARELDGEVFFSEGIAGRRAWEKNGSDAPVELVLGRPRDALWHAAQWPGPVNRWQDLSDKGHLVELISEHRTFAGQPVYVLRLTLSDGYVRDYFVDRKTLRVTGNQDLRRHHAYEATQQPIQTLFSDFRRIDGVEIAFATSEVNADTGAVLSTSIADRVEVNPILNDEMFAPPAEGCKRPDDDLAEIIERNTAARGGRQAIDSIESLKVELLIEEPDFTVTGIYRASQDGRMRIDVYMDGERVFTEAYDGESGWQLGAGESTGEVMRTETASILRRGIYDKFHGWYDFESLGLSLDYLGRELVNGQCLDEVELDYNDGTRIYQYLDPETGLIRLTRQFSALHPDIDPEKRRNESWYSDFREVDGRMQWFREVKSDVETGEIIQTTTMQSVTFNPQFDPGIFDRPVAD